MLKFVMIAGGGTGGHLFPGIAIADALKQHGAQSHFIGTKRGIEAQAVPQRGYTLHTIRARGLASRPDRLLMAILELGLGTFQSIRLLSKQRPQLLVSLGGYACAPAIVAAAWTGVPVVMLEQNSWPGKANRLLSHLCRKACISYPGTESFFPTGRAILTGNPVRPEIIQADRREARAALNIPSDNRVILITGASQGAQSLNQAVMAALSGWADQPWTVIHLTGKTKLAEVEQAAKANGDLGRLDYRPIGYSDQMPALYASADLVVSRAGATTLAELTVRGLPCILVPYPHAAENHQEKNADEIVSAGGGLKILDRDVVGLLGDTVAGLMSDEDRLGQMAQACGKLGKPEALASILQVLCQISGEELGAVELQATETPCTEEKN